MKKCDRSYFYGNEGRKLHVQEWGPEDKPAIFLVHGFPGCADHGKLMSLTSLWNSFRLISVDRPGYGQSELQPDLTPLKFASEIKSLLDEKEIHKFSIISVSGGAPYAMALAYLLKDRVTKLTSIGGIAPLTFKNFQYMNSTQKKTWFARNFVPDSVLKFALDKIWAKGLDQIEKTLFTEMGAFPEQDRKIFSDPAISPILIEVTRSALRQGPGGVLHDMKVFSKSWGFPLEDIKCPVTLWHGTLDDVVHRRFAEDMKQHLPKAKLNFIKDEGHYSILMNCRDDILNDLLQT